MGNRAWIIGEGSAQGIYVQWNGGRDSIEAFLAYAKLRGLSGLNSGQDKNGGYFAFITILCNFFGNDGYNVYPIDSAEMQQVGTETTFTDNGGYVIDGWEIIKRIHPPRTEQSIYDLIDMLQGIDEAQPEADQLGAGYITANEVDPKILKVGDLVYMAGYKEPWKLHPVIGFGSDRKVNGAHVHGVPYVDLYQSEGLPAENNVNNYLLAETVRVPKDAHTTAN